MIFADKQKYDNWTERLNQLNITFRKYGETAGRFEFPSFPADTDLLGNSLPPYTFRSFLEDMEESEANEQSTSDYLQNLLDFQDQYFQIVTELQASRKRISDSVGQLQDNLEKCNRLIEDLEKLKNKL